LPSFISKELIFVCARAPRRGGPSPGREAFLVCFSVKKFVENLLVSDGASTTKTAFHVRFQIRRETIKAFAEGGRNCAQQ
jgi:hypothetical protein